ncbi:MAG TPA: hypothetical protein VGI17_10595 [Solirubrobacterales bacterium]|jgi:predicted lipoprotein with Yx(FWY)xxD motif
MSLKRLSFATLASAGPGPLGKSQTVSATETSDLVSGEPTVGEGANSSEVGTTKRKDGTTQLTYAGHPLYTFVEDKIPAK